jgi:DnaD/phage-associated family protein
MKKFEGFPARMEYTPLPNIFLSNLLPRIEDIAELKTTLHILAMVYRKKGYPRYVPLRELLANESLMGGISVGGKTPEIALENALEMAVARGTLLVLAVEKDGTSEGVYFLNTAANRDLVAKIQEGELELAGLRSAGRKYIPTEELPDIFTLYEENVGILTPMVADELREAEKLYPGDWIRDSIKEAVLNNKRSIKYILKILENWGAEGKGVGTYQRHTKKADPDKYIKGRYGHMVRR